MGWLGLGTSLSASALLGPRTQAAPPLPFSGLDPSGWTVTAEDPASSLGATFTLLRAGHGGDGAAVLRPEPVALTARLRAPYPAHADPPSGPKLSLSDFVYASDVLPGRANPSTRPAPLPIAAWLEPDAEIVEGPVYTARLAVAHAHARAGRPVAGVRLRLSDGTTTLERLVTEMSALTYAQTGLTVPHFAADLPLADFDDASTLTLDAQILPWIGAPFLISTGAEAAPAQTLSTLRLLCNRTGSWARPLAYVDPISGTPTGTVSPLAATAAAAPFATISQAAAALRAYLLAQHGRAYADGGIIRLIEGVHSSA